MCYAFAKDEIAYWKHVSHWNGIAMKNENPEIFIDIDKLYLKSTRQFGKMLRKWKFTFFQIYSFYDFLLHKNIKSTRNPQNYNLRTLLYYLYSKQRERQQLFELGYKLKYYALLFLRVQFVVHVCLLTISSKPSSNTFCGDKTSRSQKKKCKVTILCHFPEIVELTLSHPFGVIDCRIWRRIAVDLVSYQCMCSL